MAKVYSNSIYEIEKAFSEKGISGPIIRFIGHINGKDKYLDDRTGKTVALSTDKEEVECNFCKKRKRIYNELRKYVESFEPVNGTEFLRAWNRNVDEYRKKLKECPECGNVLGSGGADYDQSTHTHCCDNCKKHFPEEAGTVYKGTYADDSLVWAGISDRIQSGKV